MLMYHMHIVTQGPEESIKFPGTGVMWLWAILWMLGIEFGVLHGAFSLALTLTKSPVIQSEQSWNNGSVTWDLAAK